MNATVAPKIPTPPVNAALGKLPLTPEDRAMLLFQLAAPILDDLAKSELILSKNLSSTIGATRPTTTLLW